MKLVKKGQKGIKLKPWIINSTNHRAPIVFPKLASKPRPPSKFIQQAEPKEVPIDVYGPGDTRKYYSPANIKDENVWSDQKYARLTGIKKISAPVITVDNEILANSMPLADSRTMWDNVKSAAKVFKQHGFNNKQSAVILANMIEESMANPTQKQIDSNGNEIDTGIGFFQDAPDRHAIMVNNTNNWEDPVEQAEYIAYKIKHGNGKTDWNPGAGNYTTWKQPFREFNNTPENTDKSLETYMRSLTIGHVRPKDTQEAIEQRLKIAEQLLKFME